MSMQEQEEDALPRRDNMKSRIAVQDNALVRSAYTMSLLEKRLLMLAISKVDATIAPVRNQCIEVEVTAEEWATTYREKDPWTDLNRAADRLMSRVVTLYPTQGPEREKLNWTDRCKYYKNKVVIRFGYSLSIELAGMLNEFTQADLLDVAKLDSFYAVRLYELLRQYQSTGLLMIGVEEFRVLMGAEKKYVAFSQLNRRVIKQAIEGIQKKMPELKLNVEYIKRRGSRAVTSLKFTFKKSEQRDLFSAVGNTDW